MAALTTAVTWWRRLADYKYIISVSNVEKRHHPIKNSLTIASLHSKIDPPGSAMFAWSGITASVAGSRLAAEENPGAEPNS